MLPVDPIKAVESWDEPWTWRPSEFPTDVLQLNVIEHETPSTIVGFGNPGASIFGYNGTIPGPTIRMQGDETYDLRLLNHLGLNAGKAPIGPAADTAAFPPDITNEDALKDWISLPDWCLGEHSNGVHSVHTTNMHTHGLHVQPGLNPPFITGVSTTSDDIFTRLAPAADFVMRQENPALCAGAGGVPVEDEVNASASYQFILGDVQGDPNQPHPPGTHWYHPHAHGSTHNQVTSGLAGFLIVEGNVDVAINTELTGEASPDPALPAGDYDYRERMLFIQRVDPGNVSQDPDAPPRSSVNASVTVTNGVPTPPTMVMRPGAIERWRILNGSVDGKGYTRFMVLRGQWVSEKPPGAAKKKPTTLEDFLASAKQLLRVNEDGTRSIPTTNEIEDAKVPLQQLAVDGITLVADVNGAPAYKMRDLNFPAPESPLLQDYSNLGDCFADAASLANCFDRPNEMYMAPANRTDMMFQAPRLASNDATQVCTVIGKGTAIHTDNLERSIQLLTSNLAYANEMAEQSDKPLVDIIADLKLGLGFPSDTIMSYVVVRNPRDKKGEVKTPVKSIPTYDLKQLNQVLERDAPLPPYLLPPTNDDLRLTRSEAADRDLSGTEHYRTRSVTYSGWGAATWPALRKEDLEKYDPDVDELGEIDPLYLAQSPTFDELVMPPIYRTMAIDGRKFNPDDKGTPRMGLDTAEEWAAFNSSIALYGELTSSIKVDFDADEKSIKDQIALRSYSINHTVGAPLTRREALDRDLGITTRGIDHPFHIHTNPMWVVAIEVPDQDGNLVNVLTEPRWHDVVWMPRSGGRVVFRSRFPDFTGKYVNHCHILLHEDNGMMQMVEVVESAADANYTPKSEVAQVGNGSVYPPVPLTESYRQCTRFIDNNENKNRYQEYPATNGVFNPPSL